MSKFFVQLLLSMVVGVSAAVGLGPQAVKIRQEVKASLRERVNIALPVVSNVTAQVRSNTSVSAQTQVKSLIKENVKLNAKARSSLNARVSSVLNNVNLSPGISLGGSTTTNAQTSTSVGANLPGIDLNLKNNIRTNLDLNSPLDLNLLP